jgi:hypothetical protein
MQKNGKTRSVRARLTLHRETLLRLSEGRLAEIAGGAPETRPPNQCLTPHSCDRTCTC